tara:strand:- start:39 stop:1025 length:987 start_codon:yes stop_codon:yes gene_type:complete
MLMRTIKVSPLLDNNELKELQGKFINEKLIKHHIIEDTKIVNENDETLAVFKKNVVPEEIINNCRRAFRLSASDTNNRGMAAGLMSDTLKIGDKVDGLTVGKIGKNRFWPLLKTGKISKSPKANKVKSGIIGYADRYPRIPFCRRTAFTQSNWNEYVKCLPYIKHVDAFFKQYAPDRYSFQKTIAENSSQDFIIKETSFSTVTVNKNFRTAAHYDKGDLREGFGNLGVISKGEYEGAITVIPKYGIGLDLRNTDLAIFDVHELHGNTEMVRKNHCERISIVCYYREKIINCGDADFELKRAKTNTKKVADEFEIEKAKMIKESILNEL